MEIFDAHFHIINPKFPLVKNKGYLPPAFDVEDYKDRVKGLKIAGGAVVSGSFQGFDREYLTDALARLGNTFCGVANIPVNYKKRDLEQLNAAGVTAVRFNLKRGGSERVKNMVSLSSKLFDEFGWHTELYLDSKNLPGLKNRLEKIKKFSIDHLGLSKAGLPELYHWVEKGVKIKATGFGRLDFDPLPVMKKIYDINPDALMFGTDLPSTRSPEPFTNKDVELITRNFSETAQRKILFWNAYNWYLKENSPMKSLRDE